MQTLRPNPFKPNETAAKLVKASLILLIVSLAIVLIYVLYAIKLTYEAMDGSFLASLELLSLGGYSTEITVLEVAPRLLLLITFLVWGYRATTHLEQSYAVRQDVTASWFVISWFIPFLNLYTPYSAMREVQHNYYMLAQRSPGNPVPSSPPATQLLLWWIPFVVGGILQRIAVIWLKTAGEAGNFDQIVYADWLAVMGLVLYFISAFMLLILINDISKQEKIVAERWQNGELDSLYDALKRSQYRALPAPLPDAQAENTASESAAPAQEAPDAPAEQMPPQPADTTQDFFKE